MRRGSGALGEPLWSWSSGCCRYGLWKASTCERMSLVGCAWQQCQYIDSSNKCGICITHPSVFAAVGRAIASCQLRIRLHLAGQRTDLAPGFAVAGDEVVPGVGVGTVAAGIGFDCCCRTGRSPASQRWTVLGHRSLADDDAAAAVAAVVDTSVAVGGCEENSNRTAGRNLRAATSCRQGTDSPLYQYRARVTTN